jgi:hypothetical protein
MEVKGEQATKGIAKIPFGGVTWEVSGGSVP